MSLLKLSLSLNKRKTRFCNNAYLNFGKSRTLILININIDAVQSSFHGRLCSVKGSAPTCRVKFRTSWQLLYLAFILEGNGKALLCFFPDFV
jgi:hypothetical protein